MQGYKLQTDLRVLGVDWLRIYSTILFDFIKMKLSFRKDGRMTESKGIIEEAGLQMITTAKDYKSLREAVYGFMG